MRTCICILLFLAMNSQVYAGFPWDKDSQNIAALFTMTNESGRTANLRMMENIFKDGSLGFKSQTHHDKDAPYIYEKCTELAREVGDNGTLLLYFNSHGGGSGSRFFMQCDRGPFKFTKALEAVAKGRKVRRLVILVDTCHASGAIQEGFEGGERRIPSYVGLPVLSNKLYNEIFASEDAYQEVLVVASSSVEDLSIRGAFASRLERAYEGVEDKNITVSGFLRKFASLHTNTRQKPHYKVMPTEKMLDEPLFNNALIRAIPIIDRNNPQGEYPVDYIFEPE